MSERIGNHNQRKSRPQRLLEATGRVAGMAAGAVMTANMLTACTSEPPKSPNVVVTSEDQDSGKITLSAEQISNIDEAAKRIAVSRIGDYPADSIQDDNDGQYYVFVDGANDGKKIKLSNGKPAIANNFTMISASLEPATDGYTLSVDKYRLGSCETKEGKNIENGCPDKYDTDHKDTTIEFAVPADQATGALKDGGLTQKEVISLINNKGTHVTGLENLGTHGSSRAAKVTITGDKVTVDSGGDKTDPVSTIDELLT